MQKREKELYEAIVKLNTAEDCFAFFHDLCTPAELDAMAGRWEVARLLDKGELSYREIHEKTGVSIATIGRVARFLNQENYKGYRRILDQSK